MPRAGPDPSWEPLRGCRKCRARHELRHEAERAGNRFELALARACGACDSHAARIAWHVARSSPSPERHLPHAQVLGSLGYSLLLSTHYSTLTTHHSLPTTHYSLLTTYYSRRMHVHMRVWTPVDGGAPRSTLLATSPHYF